MTKVLKSPEHESLSGLRPEARKTLLVWKVDYFIMAANNQVTYVLTFLIRVHFKFKYRVLFWNYKK